MKTRIATLMIACACLFTSFTYASEPVPAAKIVSSSIAQLLASEIDFPDFARVDNFECCVFVRLNIMEDGSFEVDCSNCGNLQLKRYVEEKIEKISAKQFIQYAGQSVSVKLIFKILDSY